MKLIIHDGNEEFEKSLKQVLGKGEELMFISEKQKIHHCIGCFGCWMKTPTECVIKDGYHTTPAKCRDASEIIIISKCVYGMYSPFVKNILDRTIGYVHPYFVQRNGEMHHKLRYDKVMPMKVYFYGENTQEEQELAKRIVHANQLNMNFKTERISFAKKQEDVLLQIKGTQKTVVSHISKKDTQITGSQNEIEKIALICASPKAGNSASEALLKMLESHISNREIVRFRWNQNTVSEQDLEKVAQCQALVFAFPLYVDCLPSHLLRCMQQLDAYLHTLEEKPSLRVCAIVNNGFFDAKQNVPAIEVIRNWSKSVGAVFIGGTAVGGGGMIAGVYAGAGANGPMKSIDSQMKHLAERIGNVEDLGSEINTVLPGLPKFMYKMVAEMGWRDAAKKNGLKVSDLDRK